MFRLKCFENRLVKIGRIPMNPMDSGEDYLIAEYATYKDTALFVSYSADNIRLNRIMEALLPSKCFTILITTAKDTFLTKNSSLAIRFPALETRENNIGTFYSQYAMDMILNEIYSAVFTMNYDANKDIVQRRKFGF